MPPSSVGTTQMSLPVPAITLTSRPRGVQSVGSQYSPGQGKVRTTPDAPLTAYRSAVDGLPEPLCTIYRSGSEALIAPFVERGIFCPRKILIHNDAVLLDLPESDALVNVNTPQELAASRRRTAS